MKACVKLLKDSDEISFAEVSIPEIEENELLVRVYSIGVGIHDEYFHPIDVEYPYVIGIEGAGVIERVGEKAGNYKAGERIAFINAMNKKGGTWAEYTSLPADSLIVRIPDSVSFNEAAAIPVVGNTILKAFSALEANSKDALFISGGSGAIGTLAIQIAKQKGYKIIASASKRNHDYMKSLGADIVVDYNDHDWQDQVMSFIPEGVDTAIAINPNTSKEVSVIVKNNGIVIAVSGIRSNLREVLS